MTSGKEVGSTRGDFVRLFEGASSAGLGDGDLLGRFVARRDEAAFEALVARLGPMVLGVCRRMLADPHDVDDAFQATFLVLVRRAGSIRDRHVVSTWLYEVAVRVARRARADSARRADRERQAAVADAGEEQEPRVERSEVRAWIDEEIGRLPESHRRLIVLCDVEGLTREEAAARLGWTANMVRGRLERARARLRQRLTRRGLAPSGASLVLALPPAVPRISLVAATVRGALGGAGSASACSLSIGVIRMMILARWKVVVSVLVSALGVGTALATVAARLEDGGKDRPMLVKAPAQEDASVLVAPPAKKPSGRRLPDLDKAAPSGKMVRQRPRRDANDTRPSMEGAPKAVPVRVTGLIRGLDEVPVVGATVVVLAHQSRDDPNFVDQTIEAGRATTGADGRYSFPAVVIPTSRYHNHPDGATPFIQFQVVAQAPGFGFGWHRWNSMFAVPTPDPDDTQGRLELNTPVTADIYLRPEATLKGRVIDEASNPVAGLKIQVRDIGLLDERGMETTVQTSVNPGLMPNGLGLATTDPDGRFRLSGLPMESCSWLFSSNPTRTTGGPSMHRPRPKPRRSTLARTITTAGNRTTFIRPT